MLKSILTRVGVLVVGTAENIANSAPIAEAGVRAGAELDNKSFLYLLLISKVVYAIM